MKNNLLISPGLVVVRALQVASLGMALLPSLAQADAAADLRRADANWNELRLNADVPQLQRLLADDWLLTHSDGRTQGKADYLHDLRTRSRSNQEILNEDLVVRIYGSAAIVTGVSVQSGVTDGRRWSGRFRFTRSWIQREGRWVMVASHSSRVAVSSDPAPSPAAAIPGAGK